MNASKLKKLAIVALPIAAAVAGSAILYTKTRAVDLDAHADFVDALRRVQQLNATLKQQALASRFGLLNQYDTLTKTGAQLKATETELEVRREAIAYGDRSIDDAVTVLGRALAQQRADTERFKSENSVLKNSLYYLPSAASSLTEAFAASGDARAEALIGPVNTLVQNTLVYNLLRDDRQRRQLDADHARLSDRAGMLPVALRSQYVLFLEHAHTVVHQRDVLDPLLARLSSNDVDRAARALDVTYTKRFELAVASVNRYRIALYAWSVALLAAVLIVVFKLRDLYAHLEQLVADRTRRLDAALREIWGEMQLAKKIQTALVPQRPWLNNCDVASVMLPADQVGGDYYDVLNIDGTEWVLMGDVSGHGVPAGLVMMMCQTAVHTVLESDPHIKPDRLLSIVNRALTENIRRLGETKYMTISALCRSSDGRFYFSGLHQDMFIYRARTKTVEDIESTGTWLGIMDSIDEHLTVGSFALDKGDVLLLYTDGITEAVRDGIMLDNCGLKNILSEFGTESASEIVAGILGSIANHTISDDVAAVVVKQN